MTTRLIEAAKKLRDKIDRLRGDEFTTDNDKLDAAISDAERQAADDALPYSSEWALDEFDAWFFKAGGVEVLCMPKGVFLNGAESHCSEINTRGQLRRLIEALKGGEA